jgi:hypothetical protein
MHAQIFESALVDELSTIQPYNRQVPLASNTNNIRFLHIHNQVFMLGIPTQATLYVLQLSSVMSKKDRITCVKDVHQ